MAEEVIVGTNQEQCAWIETLINKKIYQKTITRIIKLDTEKGSLEGDHYASIIQRATLTVILRNGLKSKLSVIMKCAHEDEGKLKVMECAPFFKTETMFYKEIVEKCEALMNEYQDTSDKLWCHFIGYRPYNLIVFEDLKMKNFVLADRIKMLDLNHASLVLHSLGRLHGVFYALLQKGLLHKTDVPIYYAESDLKPILNMFRGGLKMFSHVIENYWSPEWQEIGKRINNEADFIAAKLKKLLEPQENSFQTVCHGDCWTCNMMFKYCPYDENYPISMKFLDFQTVSIHSYIFDIIYFLYMSVKPKVRRTNYNELLTIYQKSLQSTLTIYGMQEKAPTLEHVQKEAERIEYYAFAVTVCTLPITTAEIKDAFKLEILNDDADSMNAYNPEIFQSDLYKSMVQPELKTWFEKGVF